MAVTIDLGEWNDIHPDNKKDVGERLALAAEKIAYGKKDIVASGPLYQSFKIEGNKIIISFTNIGGGLISIDDEELNQFAIAGADKKFVWAKAKIEGDKVVVWNDDVPEPLYAMHGPIILLELIYTIKNAFLPHPLEQRNSCHLVIKQKALAQNDLHGTPD
jgi:sialate O-acetylesterase